MSKLPRISGRSCVKVLEESGFYIRRQEGSHLVLRRNNPFSQLVVPDHKELLSESDIPILIDVLDWARVPASFRAEILKDHVVIQKPEDEVLMEKRK